MPRRPDKMCKNFASASLARPVSSKIWPMQYWVSPVPSLDATLHHQKTAASFGGLQKPNSTWFKLQTLCSQKIAPIHTRYSWFFTRYSRCRAELQNFLPRLQSDVKLHCSAPSCATLSSGKAPQDSRRWLANVGKTVRFVVAKHTTHFHLS